MTSRVNSNYGLLAPVISGLINGEKLIFASNIHSNLEWSVI